MKCPVCNNEMKVKKQDVSNNTDTGKKYDRTINICEADDVWVNVEIPQNS